jgi:hypothetical protein
MSLQNYLNKTYKALFADVLIETQSRRWDKRTYNYR